MRGIGCWLLAVGVLVGLSARASEEAFPFSEIQRDVVLRPAEIVAERDGVPVYRRVVLSRVYTIDRIYTSMRGPRSTHEFRLLDGEPEVLWLVGYRATMTEPDGDAELSPEFMCHSNLDMDHRSYVRRFPTGLSLSAGRLFTLSQGQLEVELPAGFGIPMMSDFPLDLTAQVLNHSHENASFDVRQRIAIDFVRDRDLEEPLEPLAAVSANSYKLLGGEDGHFGLASTDVDPELHGPGCSVGTDAGDGMIHSDGTGRRFTSFWVLPPGVEENHTRVTTQFRLPYDTRVHYIAAHLHPFAKALELRDRSAGETVVRLGARQTEGRIGLAHVDDYSSEEGLPLFRGHEYELVSYYDNTSGREQDAMASFFMYVHARDLYDFTIRRPARRD